MTTHDDAPDVPLRLIPLGGLGEIGMNLMVYDHGGQMIVVDCGLAFPDEETPGVDLIIPEIGFLVENREKILAYVLTHGHEDHIGALPFVWKEAPAPVYGGPMTLGLLGDKLREEQLLNQVTLRLVRPLDKVQIGPFSVQFIPMTHSIVDSSALAITTPVGTVIHTGDFKIDHTPVDSRPSDLYTLAKYGRDGVLALLSDSTNVNVPNATLSERSVGPVLQAGIAKARGLVVVATFATNIHRIQQVIDAAAACGRKVVLNGRSMVENVRTARELGHLHLPLDILVDSKRFKDHPRDKLLVLSTGSQGEPNSSLVRIAAGDHREISIKEGDTIFVSARFIPGNERAIWSLVNRLFSLGAEVFHDKNMPGIHVSGHAPTEDLKQMLALTRPRFFMPIHGEARHLKRHRALAVEMGVAEENALVALNGDVVQLDGEKIAVVGQVPSGRVFVDGKVVGDVGDVVLRDRLHLSEDGMAVVILVAEKSTGRLLQPPELLTRGVVHEDENRALLEEAKEAVLEALSLGPKGMDFNEEEEAGPKELAVRGLKRFFRRVLGRRPMVVPLLLEM